MDETTENRADLELRAREGDPIEMARFGLRLLAEGEREGTMWIEHSAQKGYWGAAYILLKRAPSAESISRWQERTLELAIPAAERGDARAASVAAYVVSLQNKQGDAVRLATLAADAGDAPAMGMLAFLLAKEDPEEALRWETRGVELDDPDSLYRKSQRLKGSDPREAQVALLSAAEKGHPNAMVTLSRAAESGGDPESEQRWLQKAADSGDAEGMYQLGVLLSSKDEPLAMKWLEEAAMLGHISAMKGWPLSCNGTTMTAHFGGWRRHAMPGILALVRWSQMPLGGCPGVSKCSIEPIK